MVIQPAQRLLLNTDKCNWVCADLFRLTAPFLLAANACHNGQAWLKGEQQTLWLTGHLTHLVMSALM